jgi:hypothetical protein
MAKEEKQFGNADITNRMIDHLLIQSNIIYNLFKESRKLDARSSEIIVMLGSSCQTAGAT